MVIVALSACIAGVHAAGGGSARASSQVRLVKIHYLAHGGVRRNAYALLPSWYGPRNNPPLALVISPHGRGLNGRENARIWGDLPAIGSFIVVNPDGRGRRLPDYSWGYERRGDAFAQKGDVARAIEEYTTATRFDPRNRSAFVSRGILYATNGDPDRAIQDFDQATRLNPNHALAFTWRAAIYLQKGDTDRSIRDLDEAIRINPKDDVSLYNRGRDHDRKGDYDRAIRDYDEAARLNPKSYLTFLSRGIAYQHKDDLALVLIDLTMPVMSGEEALSHIKSIHPTLPIILSSGYKMEAIQRFAGKGLAGFLQKPYTRARLAEKLRALGNKR